jgi:DNA repair ATPase RecN
MKTTKKVRKELTLKLTEKIKEAFAHSTEKTVKKMSKKTESAAKKLAKRVTEELDKLSEKEARLKKKEDKKSARPAGQVKAASETAKSVMAGKKTGGQKVTKLQEEEKPATQNLVEVNP